MASLADQLRAMPGNWYQGGIDRAAELAQLLAAKGITSLDGLNLKQVANPLMNSYTGGDGDGAYSDPAQMTQLFQGDQPLGFLGNVGGSGPTGSNANPGMMENQPDGSYGVGWSPAGHGSVTYRAVQGPDGKMQIQPVWASSSAADQVRNVGKVGLAALGASMIPTAAGSLAGSAAGTAATEGGLLSMPSTFGGTIAANGAPLAASGFAPLTAAEIGGGLSSLAGPGSLAALGGSAALGGAAGGGSGLAGALGSADKAAMFGDAGYGAGMTGKQTGIFDGVLNATGSTTAANAATNLLGNLPLGNLATAALGALSSKDQTQAKKLDPWGPAQDFIKSQIGQGQQLANQYQQQPFSAAQQTGYNNLGGLLNAINGGAQGLLSGFSANASGANNYDRNNPKKLLTGSNFNLGSFNPGLLQFFPKGG